MPKKRIQIEIKPCCHNCYYKDKHESFCKSMKRNPCANWSPAMSFFGKKLDAAEKKMDKAPKAAKKPKPWQDDDEDEYLDVY